MTTGAPTPRKVVVLDTNLISELMRSSPDTRVEAWVREVPPAAVHTTSALPFDAAAADQYGEIVVERERAGRPISGFDAQIATICRCRRASLATRNTEDFGGLSLEVLDPWVGTTSGDS